MSLFRHCITSRTITYKYKPTVNGDFIVSLEHNSFSHALDRLIDTDLNLKKKHKLGSQTNCNCNAERK